MNKELSIEIIKQITDEAEKYSFVVPYNNSKSFYIEDKVKGYAAGATPYAIKWQEAELRAERYEKALKAICGNDGSLIPAKHDMIALARIALTPKQGTDDTVNG